MQIIPFLDFVRRYYSGEEFVLFDTETTGLNTFHDHILEVGATIWDKNGIKSSFEELIYVHPNKISQEAWNIHQIPKEEIERARPPEQVLGDFKSFCGGRAMVAHNIKFDFPMFNSNLVKCGLTPYPNDEVACTLIYSKEQMLPGKLSELAAHCKVDTKKGSLHRALYDVNVLAQVLEAMMKQNEPKEMQYSLIL